MKPLRLWLLSLLALASATMVFAQQKSADSLERHFETLTVGELAFTNVWVHRQTNFNILIRHSGGIHTIKLTDLPDRELAALKSQIGDLAAVDEPAPASKAAASWIDKLKAFAASASPQTLAIAGAAGVLALILLIALVRRRGSSAPSA